MTHLSRLWTRTRGQDLAEYGIALSVIGSIVVTVAFLIRLELFVLWFRGAFRIMRAVSGS